MSSLTNSRCTMSLRKPAVRAEFGGFYLAQAILMSVALLRTSGLLLHVVALMAASVAVF